MKIYNLRTFSSALEFLAILALSMGHLLKVSLISHFSFKTNNVLSFLQGGTPDILSAVRQALIDRNH